MSRCRRCNRVLKSQPWAALGIGKVCSKKEAIQNQKQENGDEDIIVPYDGGDIWIERLEPDRRTTSQLRTNIQRIEYYHSPTGFNYGYWGSGPADAALNILLMFTDKKTAHDNHQQFKFEYLGQDVDKLVIPKQTVLDFLANIKTEKHDTIPESVG